MITFQNIQMASDKTRRDLTLPSEKDFTLDASHLIAFPGLIDPHVHFRTPGLEYKENWETASKACIMGGYVAAFDMPNTLPPTTTYERVIEKKALIESQLKKAKIPLHYGLYLGADKHHFDEIHKAKNEIVALKIFMGSTTGNLTMDDDSSLHAAFAIASSLNLLVCVHAEDEKLIHSRISKEPESKNYRRHSEIRSAEVALKATEKAICLSKLYKTRLHILHLSTKDEIHLIRKAKEANLPVTCETTPHHLFLDDAMYDKIHGCAVINPPIRSKDHREALQAALKEGVIDTIGSDHAPHTLEEKAKPYPHVLSGVPGVETTLPLLLNAYHHGILTLDQIIKLTYSNILKIYQIPPHNDWTIVDLNLEKSVDNYHLKTKCQWSPYAGMKLKGWPTYVLLKGQIFNLLHPNF